MKLKLIMILNVHKRLGEEEYLGRKGIRRTQRENQLKEIRWKVRFSDPISGPEVRENV